MNIVNFKHENMSDYGKTTTCNVYSIHVKVDDISSKAKAMITMIQDTSWIEKLDIINQKSFEVRARKTIEKLVHDILLKVENTVSEEFGEFLISVTALDSLEFQYSHKKVPLAELFKERKTGNGSFDFHTETHGELIAFGEAKYSGSSSRYRDALEQIASFISDEKDISDMADIRHFVSENSALKVIQDNKKAFVAAFSINAINPSKIIKNALSSIYIDDLLVYDELYIIGIEVDA